MKWIPSRVAAAVPLRQSPTAQNLIRPRQACGSFAIPLSQVEVGKVMLLPGSKPAQRAGLLGSWMGVRIGQTGGADTLVGYATCYTDLRKEGVRGDGRSSSSPMRPGFAPTERSKASMPSERRASSTRGCRLPFT